MSVLELIKEFTDNNGVVWMSSRTDQEAWEFLRYNWNGHLATINKSSFARGLSETPFAKLSGNQIKWCHILACMVDVKYTYRSPAPTVAPIYAPPKPHELNPIRSLFATSRSKLRFSFMDTVLVISQAQAHSENAGCLYVSRGTRGGKSNTYYGKITVQGQFHRASGAPVEVFDTLRAIALDPLGYATGHGHKEVWCCFCGVDLTDDRSKEKGYGPDCAKKRGLPWGKRA